MTIIAPNSKPATAPKLGSKEAQVRALREEKACKIDHSAHGAIPKDLCVVCTPRSAAPATKPAAPAAKPTAEAKAPAKSKESDVRTSAEKKSATKKAREPVKGKTKSAPANGGGKKHSVRPDGLRAGSKVAMTIDLVKRPKGATSKEICEAVKFPSICRSTIEAWCKKAKVKLKVEKEGDKPRYFAA